MLPPSSFSRGSAVYLDDSQSKSMQIDDSTSTERAIDCRFDSTWQIM